MKKFLFLLLPLFFVNCAGHFAQQKLTPPEISSEKPIQEILVASLGDGFLLAMTQSDPDVGIGATGEGGGPSCSTAIWSNLGGTPSGDIDINDAVTSTYVGNAFTPTGSGTSYCAKFTVTYKAGDISEKTFSAFLVALDGSHEFSPGSLTEADSTITGSNSWSNTEIQFEWASGFAYSATEYALLITMNGGYDVDNYAELEYDGDTVFPSGARGSWDNTGGNTAYATNGDSMCAVYSD